MQIDTIRHSLAHILAVAVQELYPGTKFGIGPAIENGFYYDFELPKTFTPENLPKIEKKMKEIIKQNIVFKKKIITQSEAKRIFKNQLYKLELINELPGVKATIYESGKFIDLCKGPHVKSTKEINPDAFELTKIAGAYWKGSEKNAMLTRIYGIAFKTKKELQDHLFKESEAEKRDHRVLGEKLNLFLFDEEVGAGLPIWQPKGTILRKIIENYLYEELLSQGYQWVTTPHIGKISLWQTSGHWELYRENIYSPIDIEGEKYLLKPMNCPFHVKIYQSKIRSYKDLPLKYAELGTVYRYEKSGVLHGLTRVRGFTQDDAHIFCTPEQLSQEITNLLKAGFKMLKTFGFKDYEIYLSTMPEKYAGNLKEWGKATNVLKYVLQKLKLKWQVDPGGGVFYGPKIDIKIKDSLGRPWQCTTVQVDFNLPERFDLTYINEKGKRQRPFMIHRALLGSLERFIGVLIEHYSGSFPFWLAPVQIWIIPIGKKHEKYANQVGKELSTAGFRVEVKNENETVSKKVRNGEIQKIPYFLVVGDEEMKTKQVRVRERNKGDIGLMQLNKFLAKIK
ncbi:MAG: threonine--tRNA ligase [Candidatus Nealsonbacteria bacterium CG02_land_8_20_14_3_00_37_10]|uniref:Threonine--tRNA ligase n=2 Tax=Candidatus Nealsoniibacteriota TaxID=1817911 RepID=A0A2G9YXT5_9BACT|nr:MAG: threonine--tRNA ligase [Candidatus Nealsonbacteria bacterium CG23_combo_of_CG06-09_8_20_14_all_37_18]PIV45146.1 MAG: threonine--tRNA ligase [Candidatus Nealsonbacteria bacterium CG02_land_8_20_14_3_00_37_10]